MRSIVHLWLIVLILLSTLGLTTYRLQDPEFLLNQAREVNLYNRIITKYDTFLPSSLAKQGQLTSDEMKEVLSYAIDGQTFYSLLGMYLTSYLDYYTGRVDKLYFGYDLSKVTGRAKEKTTQILSAKYYTSLPECKSSQLRDWNMTDSLPTCRLGSSNVAQTDVDRQLAQLATKMYQDVPNSIIIDKASNNAKRTRTIVSLDIKINYGIWIATGVLLALYLLIRRRKALFSLGVILLLVGGAEVGLSFFAWDYLAKNIVDYATSRQDLTAYSAIISDITDVTAQVLKTTLGTISIVTLGTGIALLVLAIFARAKKVVPLVSA